MIAALGYDFLDGHRVALALTSIGGNKYAEHYVARHCGGFYRGDGNLGGSHNVVRLASKGGRDSCIRAADGFALRTMPRKSRWRRQTQGIRPKVPGKRQQVARQMRSQSG